LASFNDYATLRDPARDPAQMLARTLAHWGGGKDLWLFGYASLIWNPGFEFTEQRAARIFGHHRALQMLSRINRGTPEQPGLVFALISGGSCQGVVYRVPRSQGAAVLRALWQREMPTATYNPHWLQCHTARGVVSALAFVLPRSSPNYTGALSMPRYRKIFTRATGRYGSTRDYALKTYLALQQHGIEDGALRRILQSTNSLP
jgi:glutathione-specific gamma-glutamylcyclotransferase